MAVLAGRGVSSGRSGTDNSSGARGNDVSQREDLANFISMITRDETPFMSTIGKTKATAIYHEWQTDQLETPGNSVIGEGTDFLIPGSSLAATTGGDAQFVDANGTFNVVGPQRHRLGNYTQINGKTISVSGTRRAIDQAGVADEYAYQLKKRGTELRRDIEHDLIHSFNTSQTGGTFGTGQSNTGSQRTAAARTFGGYQSWINKGQILETAGTLSNQALGGNVRYVGQWESAGSATTAGTGVNTVRSTLTSQGTPNRGALSLSDIDAVMQSIYQNGGKASKIMVSPKLRRDFSDLMVTDSGVRRNIDMDGKLRQSVDIYMSDFGDLMVMPNYIMGLGNMVQFTLQNGTTDLTATTNVADFSAFIYDPMWFNIATLRPLQEVDVGQRGDSTVGMMVEECSLEVRNPQGCGAIYGLN